MGMHETGKYFFTIGYWLCPVSLEARVGETLNGLLDYRTQMSHAVGDPSELSETKRIDTDAEARAKQREQQGREISLAWAASYNSQPSWHLKGLSSDSSAGALRLLGEFIRMVRTTSANYDWIYQEPRNDLRWRVHGWKHVDYESIQSVWDDYSQRVEHILLRTEALGTEEDVRDLFIAAANQDPEALGIVWRFFPTPEEHNEIIDFLRFLWPELNIKESPHPAELAADLVSTLFSNPDSNEADEARTALLKLISPSVARGGRMRKGRPRVLVPRSGIRLLWKMSNCLVKQVLEVNSYLTLHTKREKDRLTILLKDYPWITDVERNLETFLSYEPGTAALRLLSRLTKLSVSSLEKMRIRSID
jgi:hypothetical protein